jgi:hypothetical protein
MGRRHSLNVVIAAAVVVLLVAARNWAQNSDAVNVQFHGFEDTRSVTVLSPTADLSKDFTDRTNLRVNFGVDAISAASDSCARCHRGGATDRRFDGGATVTRKVDAFKLSVGGAYSQERFYRATTFLTSVSRDLADANTTIAGGYTFSLNQPRLHPTEQVENQYQNDAFVSATQTLSKLTIAQLGYQLETITGYQSNPFLRANLNGSLLLGQVPDSRVRQTFTARVRQALPAETFLEADYRHYFDDWQVRSDAVSAGVSHHFSPLILGNVSYRRYDQTGAYFYQPSYVGPVPQYFTADYRLEPFVSGLYTGRLVVTPPGPFLWLPAGVSLTLQYERYRADNGFQAAVFSGGVRVPLGSK